MLVRWMVSRSEGRVAKLEARLLVTKLFEQPKLQVHKMSCLDQKTDTVHAVDLGVGLNVVKICGQLVYRTSACCCTTAHRCCRGRGLRLATGKQPTFFTVYWLRVERRLPSSEAAMKALLST